MSALGKAMRQLASRDALSAAFKSAPKVMGGLEVPLERAAPALSAAEHASRHSQFNDFMPAGNRFKMSGDNTMTNYEQGVKTALAQMGFKVAGDEDGVTVHDGPPSTAKSEAKPEAKKDYPKAEGAEAGAETGAAAGAQAAEGQMDDQAIEAALAQLSPEELMQLLEQLPPEEVEAAMQALGGQAGPMGSPAPTLPGGQGLGMLPPGGQPGTPCPPAEEAAPAMPPHPDGGAKTAGTAGNIALGAGILAAGVGAVAGARAANRGLRQWGKEQGEKQHAAGEQYDPKMSLLKAFLGSIAYQHGRYEGHHPDGGAKTAETNILKALQAKAR